MNERLGVIGLGRMGWALAARFAEQGADVRGWTRSGVDAGEAAASGFESVARIEDIVAASDVLILSLFDDAAVRDVLERLATFDLSDRLIVETSTISPNVARTAVAAIEAAGGRLIDAPISGGPEMVSAGTIGLFVGGTTEDAARFWPIGALVSDKMAHIGDVGAGMAMKVVNNIVAYTSLQGVIEAVTVGNRLGLDGKLMLEVLAASPVTSPFFEARLKKFTGQDQAVGFTIDGLVKDARVLLEVAALVGAETPALNGLIRELTSATDDALGERDIAALVARPLGFL